MNLGYIRTDAAGDEGGIAVLVPAWNPERQRWESRGLTTFDFRPYAESQPGLGGIPNGADVFEAEGRYVSIVGTNDSGGVAGWASAWGDGCQSSMAGFPTILRMYQTLTRPIVGVGQQHSPIEGVSNPTRDGCPDAGFDGHTMDLRPDFTFAADSSCPGDDGRKQMDTIVSDHDGGNHHEVFYFTDEHGESRWERWECDMPYPDHDYITDRAVITKPRASCIAYGVNEDRADHKSERCHLLHDGLPHFTTLQSIDVPGYQVAAWHHGAVLYFSGNILQNGDFSNTATVGMLSGQRPRF